MCVCAEVQHSSSVWPVLVFHQTRMRKSKPKDRGEVHGGLFMGPQKRLKGSLA